MVVHDRHAGHGNGIVWINCLPSGITYQKGLGTFQVSMRISNIVIRIVCARCLKYSPGGDTSNTKILFFNFQKVMDML